MEKNQIPSGRGTKLFQIETDLEIEIINKQQELSPILNNALMIMGDLITRIGHLGIASQNGYKIRISAPSQFMLVNTSEFPIEFTVNYDLATSKILYDPYLLEHESHQDFDAQTFQQDHPVPEGYVDVLAKWYSIKFTYPDENYIFIRPGLGISFQTHKMREEVWEVLEGNPIIISGSKVLYDNPPKTIISHPFGAMHTVINSSDQWILIKETYKGTFDEEDIERVFNPNHYGV